MSGDLRERRLEARGRFFLAAGAMFGSLRHLMDENWLDPDDVIALRNMRAEFDKALSLVEKPDLPEAEVQVAFTWSEASEGVWVAQSGIVEILVRSGPTGFSWFAYTRDQDRDQLDSGVSRELESAMRAAENAALTCHGGTEGAE